LSKGCLRENRKMGCGATPLKKKLKQNAKREMRLRLGKVTVADVLAAQPVTKNLLKFMRASIKMICVSNLQSFIASMTQKLTLSDISDESKNYLDKAGITTACLRIKSKWFFFQEEDGIRYWSVTGVQTCALPIFSHEFFLTAGNCNRRRCDASQAG